jgi:hypothetical protein
MKDQMKDQKIKEVIKDRYGKIVRGEALNCCANWWPTNAWPWARRRKTSA